MLDAETWLTAEDCLRLGLADRYAEKDADMSQAAQVLQHAKLNLEQRISIQKSLAAQLREMVQTPTPAAPPAKDPSAEPQGRTILEMFA